MGFPISATCIEFRNKYGFATSVQITLCYDQLEFFTMAEAEVLSLQQCA